MFKTRQNYISTELQHRFRLYQLTSVQSVHQPSTRPVSTLPADHHSGPVILQRSSGARGDAERQWDKGCLPKAGNVGGLGFPRWHLRLIPHGSSATMVIFREHGVSQHGDLLISRRIYTRCPRASSPLSGGCDGDYGCTDVSALTEQATGRDYFVVCFTRGRRLSAFENMWRLLMEILVHGTLYKMLKQPIKKKNASSFYRLICWQPICKSTLFLPYISLHFHRDNKFFLIYGLHEIIRTVTNYQYKFIDTGLLITSFLSP